MNCCLERVFEIRIVRMPAGGFGPEFVNKPFPLHRQQNARFVIVSHCSAEFLVVHSLVAFELSPQFGYFVALHEPETAFLVVFPADVRRTVLRVQKQVPDELPYSAELRLGFRPFHLGTAWSTGSFFLRRRAVHRFTEFFVYKHN